MQQPKDLIFTSKKYNFTPFPSIWEDGDLTKQYHASFDPATDVEDTAIVIGISKESGHTLFYPVNQLSPEEFQQLVERLSRYYNTKLIKEK